MVGGCGKEETVINKAAVTIKDGTDDCFSAPKTQNLPSSSSAPKVKEPPKPPPGMVFVKNALVIDDHGVSRNGIMALLTRLGYEEIDQARDGAEGLAAMKEKMYSVTFLAIDMKESMNGLDCTKEIRAWESKSRKEKPQFICGMTSNESTQSIKQLLKSGMNDIITKVINLPKIEAVFAEAGELAMGTKTDPAIAVAQAKAAQEAKEPKAKEEDESNAKSGNDSSANTPALRELPPLKTKDGVGPVQAGQDVVVREEVFGCDMCEADIVSGKDSRYSATYKEDWDLCAACHNKEPDNMKDKYKHINAMDSKLPLGGFSIATSDTPKVITENEWTKDGGTQEEFKKLDTNGDGVLDQVELNILDISTWDISTAKAKGAAMEMSERGIDALSEYIGNGGKLSSYHMLTTLEDRAENLNVLKRAVRMNAEDADILDKAICVMTVRRLRMGRPEAFSDAFP